MKYVLALMLVLLAVAVAKPLDEELLANVLAELLNLAKEKTGKPSELSKSIQAAGNHSPTDQGQTVLARTSVNLKLVQTNEDGGSAYYTVTHKVSGGTEQPSQGNREWKQWSQMQNCEYASDVHGCFDVDNLSSGTTYEFKLYVKKCQTCQPYRTAPRTFTTLA